MEDYFDADGEAPVPVESDVSTDVEAPRRRADKGQDAMHHDYDRKYEPAEHGRDRYGYRIDDLGNRIRKTRRPPYIMPDDWYAMSYPRRIEAEQEYQEQKEKWKALETKQPKPKGDSSSSGIPKEQREPAAPAPPSKDPRDTNTDSPLCPKLTKPGTVQKG